MNRGLKINFLGERAIRHMKTIKKLKKFGNQGTKEGKFKIRVKLGHTE